MGQVRAPSPEEAIIAESYEELGSEVSQDPEEDEDGEDPSPSRYLRCDLCDRFTSPSNTCPRCSLVVCKPCGAHFAKVSGVDPVVELVVLLSGTSATGEVDKSSAPGVPATLPWRCRCGHGRGNQAEPELPRE